MGGLSPINAEKILSPRYRALHARMSHRTGTSPKCHGKQNLSISVTKPKPLLCAQTYLDIIRDYTNWNVFS